jgi:hypothetical protein
LSCSEVWSLISKPSNVVANSLGVQEIDISVTSTTESNSKREQQQEEEDFGATVKLSSSLKKPKKEEKTITDEDFDKMSDEELTKRVGGKIVKKFRQVKSLKSKILKLY